jgi:membrane peptidoglycan carboxypeptidase
VIGIIGGMLITLCGLLGMIGYYFYVIGEYRNSVSNLRESASKFETTEIYDYDGNLLAQFADTQDLNAGAREEVPLDQVSPWLIHATVSTENETFYTDPGFSVYAIARATYQNLRAGSTVSGASTITQQLARALVLDQEIAYQRTNERKIMEVIVASEISRQYTKNQILEIYLNEIFYGNFAYGAEAAAQTYFGKSAAALNPAEAAFLAGLPQSPASYDPVVNREAAINRMHTVLRLMAEANGSGCIAIQHNDQTEWAVPDGGSLCITAVDGADGQPIYYYQTPTMAAPEEMTLMIAQVEIMTFQQPDFDMRHPHFVNYVWQQLEDTYGSQAIYGAGFRVYTTLDETIQAAAEESATRNITELQQRGIDGENAAVIVMRPSDGAVIAMVGSLDYNNDDIDGQVNVAFTGQQPGSSIKPLVYLTAFTPDANGRYLTPASIMWDTYSDFNGYIPTNFDSQYHGPETVRSSLGNSLNVPAVKALNFVGVERFTEAARQYGLRFPLGDPIEVNAGLTTALGAVEVRLFDMVGAYAMLANNGRYVDPYAIVYIEDSKGNVIYRANTAPEGRQVVPAEYAYLVTSILSDNNARALEFGTTGPLVLQGGRPAAVKTGTTNDSRDVWAIGYTPQYVVGVWVGNTDNRPMWGVYGYTGAAPIWNEVMEAAHASQPIQQFTVPPNVIQAEVCSDSGGRPSPSCPLGSDVEIFAASAPPPADTDVYRIQSMQVDSFSLKLANDACADAVETLNFVVVDDPTAYSWINGTDEGRTWAQARGIVVPASAPPTEYCDPNQPRPFVNITFPQEGQTYFGSIPVRGIISMPDFAGYEVRYGVSNSPQSFSEPVISNTQMPTGEAVLGQFDLSTLESGQYTVRVLVYNTAGRNVHRDIHITVNNQQAPPAATQQPQATTSTEPTNPGTVPFSTLAPTFTPELADEPTEGE